MSGWEDARGSFRLLNGVWTFVESAVAGAHYAQIRLTSGVSSSDTMKFSFLVKRSAGAARNLNAIVFSTDNSLNGRGTAEYTLGGSGSVITSTGANASGVTAQITPLADGWYRGTLTVKPDSLNGPNVTVHIRLRDGANASYTGDGTSGLQFKDMQLEILGTSALAPSESNLAAAATPEAMPSLWQRFINWLRTLW